MTGQPIAPHSHAGGCHRQVCRLASLATLLFLAGGCSPPEGGRTADGSAAAEREVLYWYDPMQPEQRFDEPGPSPFMDMDLRPRYADEEKGLSTLTVAPVIQQTLNIRTTAVVRQQLARKIDAPGIIRTDASRIHHLHTQTEGWIRDLHIHAVGEQVRPGQLLYTFYSPQLVNAQEEYLQALSRGNEAHSSAARSRLEALGVQAQVLDALARDRRASSALPWRAPQGGTVSALNVRAGMFVQPGTILMELADFSAVWITAEVFPHQADWLAIGQAAEIRSARAPGEVSHARVAWIYPEAAEDTRTVRVRIPVENPDQHWQPGMWVSVRILAPDSEDLLVIPSEALIRTGHAHRVIVQDDARRFSVREVTPGMESGRLVAIAEGLQEGERIVTSGHFLLDSEASLRGGIQRLERDDVHRHGAESR